MKSTLSRRTLVVLGLCCFLGILTIGKTSAADEPTWKTIISGEQASVAVEKALYRKPDVPQFFVHVRIHNNTKAELGIYAPDANSLFYVNQWVDGDEPTRWAVDERRSIPPPLSARRKDKVLMAFNEPPTEKSPPDPALVRIPAAGDFDYYVRFNGSETSVSDLEFSKHKYALIVMDGYMNLTDGSEMYVLQRASMDVTAGEVPIALPVKWQTIPAGAKIYDDAKVT
jgi:hypothetical protein